MRTTLKRFWTYKKQSQCPKRKLEGQHQSLMPVANWYSLHAIHLEWRRLRKMKLTARKCHRFFKLRHELELEFLKVLLYDNSSFYLFLGIYMKVVEIVQKDWFTMITGKKKSATSDYFTHSTWWLQMFFAPNATMFKFSRIVDKLFAAAVFARSFDGKSSLTVVDGVTAVTFKSVSNTIKLRTQLECFHSIHL